MDLKVTLLESGAPHVDKLGSNVLFLRPSPFSRHTILSDVLRGTCCGSEHLKGKRFGAAWSPRRPKGRSFLGALRGSKEGRLHPKQEGYGERRWAVPGSGERKVSSSLNLLDENKTENHINELNSS